MHPEIQTVPIYHGLVTNPVATKDQIIKQCLVKLPAHVWGPVMVWSRRAW